MDGGRLAGGNASKGDGGDATVGKGGGVAGVDLLIGVDEDAQLAAEVADIGHGGLLGGTAGDEVTHGASDHVQIDAELDLRENVLMIGAVSLGAQQSTLLATTPDKAQTSLVGMGATLGPP